jgi:hypothetical protein
VLESSEALSLLHRRIAQSRWVSCWQHCRFTIVGASSDEQIHERAIERLAGRVVQQVE